MSCSTYIYKRVTTKEEALRLIKAALTEAKTNLEFWQMNPNLLNDPDDEVQFNDFMDEVKKGNWIYDADVAFYRFSTGKWIYRFELTFDAVEEGFNNVIKMCEEFLSCPRSFEEMKKFILDNYDYWDFEFTEPCSLLTGEDFDADYERYTSTKIVDDEIYVHSDKIQHDVFEGLSYFRVFGYPCEMQYEYPTYYMTSPAGKEVFGWTNADELIEFLDWWKNTKWGKESEKPYVITPERDEITGFGEAMNSVIRDFFKSHEGEDLLIHFG